MICTSPAGIWMAMLLSLPPASINSTRVPGSADSRLASTHPADPAPTMMKSQLSLTAVFTGTFDPLTLGHLDVIRRGRLLFEHVVVGIGVNPNKASLFSIEERVERSVENGRLTRREGQRADAEIEAIRRYDRSLRTRNGNLSTGNEQRVVQRIERLQDSLRDARQDARAY